MSNRKTLIELNNVTARVRNNPILPATTWKIETGRHWAVIGPNGSGKSTLVGILTGQVPVIEGHTVRLCPPTAIRSLSFEKVDRLMAREEILDDGRHFANQPGETTTARDIIQPDSNRETFADVERVTQAMGIHHLLKSSIRHLSSGEFRKVLLARAMTGNPRLLILDEPYEGLDAEAGETLSQTIPRLMQSGVGIVLVTHQLNRISHHFTHVLCVKSGRVMEQGPRERILVPDKITDLYTNSRTPRRISGIKTADNGPASGRELICLRDTTVAYGNKVVLDRLNWTLCEGENWAVLGPNGSGKSTLVQLITGDHPQAYANHIRLFGRRRGSGESIWEIKKHIGLISSELQIRYRKGIRVIEVIRSGFFDSVGLYRRCSRTQNDLAEQWLENIDLTAKRAHPFNQLSYGEKRLVLLARAMVKPPQLLVMDEPCQGLDPENRRRILSIVEQICSEAATHLLFITHLPEEIPHAITRVLELAPPK
ncbi:MAG: ATP-binding cassette domain-containing protein [Desulfobacterales bacterium]|nr:ATP-binding cassette domain-containing protein [Desulfobacterales bacterium]